MEEAREPTTARSKSSEQTSSGAQAARLLLVYLLPGQGTTATIARVWERTRAAG